MRHRLVPLAAIVALAASCGGEDRLSQGELVAKGDAICEKYDKKLEALPEPQSVDDLVEYTDKGKGIVEDGVAELKELQPPEDLEAKYDEWLAYGDKAVRAFERLNAAAKKGDEAEIESIATDAQADEAKSNALAREIGFKKCGEAD